MRYTTLTIVTLSLTAATAFGQQPSGSNSATPQREQRRESDSTFIAREWAAWNALKNADSAAFVHAIGSSPSLFFVSGFGVSRASTAQFAGQVTKCDTRSSKLDMFNVVHPNDDTAILIYRVTLDRRCGTAVDRGLQQMVMTVWARRNGRWEAVAQSLTPLTMGNNLK
jgi:ketosteroid isomerase-like protein